MRKEKRPKLLDAIEDGVKDFGATLGFVDDSVPMPGTKAYQRLRVNKLMDEDCISMHNEPIDPIETGNDMAFDLGKPREYSQAEG